jgi:hypothetical protein
MPQDRPFYATVCFSVLVTLAILIAVPFFALVVIGQSSSDEDLQRSGRAIGGIVPLVVAAYWIIVFPRLRKL